MLLQQSEKKSLVAAHQKKKWNNNKKKRKREDIDMQVDEKLSLSHSRRDVNTTNGNDGDKVTSNSATEGNAKQQVNNCHQRHNKKHNNGRRNHRYNKKSTTNNHHHGLNNGGGGGDSTSNKKKQQSIQNKRSTQNNKPTLKNNVPPTLQGPQSSAQQSSRSSKQHGERSQPTNNDNHQSSAATTGKKKKSNNNKTRIVCIAEKSLLQIIRQNNPSVYGSNVKEGEENDNEAAEGSAREEGYDHANEQLLLDMPKDMINDLPQYQPRKKIVVITNATQSNAAVAFIRKELLYDQQHKSNSSSSSNNNGNADANNTSSFQYLGFDTETKPKYHKGGTGNPPALLQLATSSTAYLFRLVVNSNDGSSSSSSPNIANNNKNTVMTSSLLDLLSDTSIIKIGVGIHKDVIELQSIYGPECCGSGGGSSLSDNDTATYPSSSYLDLTTLVKVRYPKLQRTGLRNLTATVLHYRLAKSQQMANWEQVYYSRAMEVYAAADALVALDLLDAILA